MPRVDAGRVGSDLRHGARVAARKGRRTVGNAVHGDRPSIIKVAVAAILVVVLIVGISSCVRGCSSTSDTTAQTEPATEASTEAATEAADTRVATGIDADVSASFSEQLDEGEQLSWIASHAADYPYEKLLKLALKEPAAIGYVYDFPNKWGTETTAQAFTDTVTKGTYPELYQWDERWGYVSYCDMPLGLSGCGPTSLSMAYMGLTGKNDETPADIAQMATDDGYIIDGATSSDLFLSGARSLGLTSKTIGLSADDLTDALSEGKVVIVSEKAGSRWTEVGHLMLVTGLNADGSVTIHDPYSKENTDQPWAAGTIVADADNMYALSYDG